MKIPRTLFRSVSGRSFQGYTSALSRKKVLPGHKRLPFHARVTPINFFEFAFVLQNNVVDRSIDNHVFSECQELTSDLKVARPVDGKMDFQLETYKIFFAPKIWHPILLRVATRSVRGLQLRSNF